MQMPLEATLDQTHVDARRPTALDFAAALLLLATVVLHVVAIAPTYFVGAGSLMSQADQAALYAVLAASWALALVVGLTGPHRTPIAAAVAVGLAVTELGFRVADLGDALRYGTGTVGNGLWLMEAAWAVGAVGAATAVLAARARHRRPQPGEPTEWQIDWSAPDGERAGANPYAESHSDQQHRVAAASPEAPPEAATVGTASPEAEDTTEAAVGTASPEAEDTTEAAVGTASPEAEDTTEAVHSAVGGDTAVLGALAGAKDDPHERLAWSLLVAVLAIVVAGAFLPAWDHAVAVSTQTGQTVTRSLGNAFSGPWQQVVGTVLTAVALLVVPIVAIRLRHKALGAALVSGALLVLTAQFVSAVVQVDQVVPPADFGISQQQARELGLQLSLKLTGWFTLDALAAYALFAAVMVWATLRVVHENSAGTAPRTPASRRDWMRSTP